MRECQCAGDMYMNGVNRACVEGIQEGCMYYLSRTRQSQVIYQLIRINKLSIPENLHIVMFVILRV